MGDWMFLCEPQLKRLFFVIHDFSRTLSKFDKRNYCEFEHFNFESSLWIRVILVIFKMLGNIPDESNVSKKEAVAFFFLAIADFYCWHICHIYIWLFYDFYDIPANFLCYFMTFQLFLTFFVTLRMFSDKWQPYISLYGFSLTRIFLYIWENPKKTCIRSPKALQPKN